MRALFSYGNPDGFPRDQMIDYNDVDRVRREWFVDGSPLAALTRLGVNLRGPANSAAAVFLAEMAAARARNLRVAIHAGQGPRPISAVDLARQGLLDPSVLLVHFLRAGAADRAAMLAMGTSLSLSMHSELRLGVAGDVRAQLLHMLNDGVNVCLSLDANSLAPVNMFEALLMAWSLGIPWQGDETAALKPVSFRQALQMATINGAQALGLARPQHHRRQARRCAAGPSRRSEHGAGR